MSLVAALMLGRAMEPPPAPPPPPAVVAPAPPPPAPPPPIRPPADPARPLGPDVAVSVDQVGDEIVILARKLRLVHVHLTRTGRTSPASCKVLRSSGDAEVDQLTCDAVVACAAKHPARDTPIDVMTQCTRDEQARRVEELAEKRIQEEIGN